MQEDTHVTHLNPAQQNAVAELAFSVLYGTLVYNPLFNGTCLNIKCRVLSLKSWISFTFYCEDVISLGFI